MNIQKYSLLVFSTLITLILGTFSYGDEATKSSATAKDDVQTKIQMHEHMADMHTKAAECLKSGKAEKDCHQEMMSMCKDMKGDCPMMADMEKMHKHMHGKMKKEDAPSVEDHSAHHPEGQ